MLKPAYAPGSSPLLAVFCNRCEIPLTWRQTST